MVKNLLWVVVSVALVAGCSREDKEPEAKTGPLSIYTVNYPLAYFAERIGGDSVKVVFPEMEGDPAFWKPSPEQVGAYQSADLILLNGASYAKWTTHVSLPASKMVDTSASFSDQFIPLEDQGTHSHGPGGAHEHGDVAFTTWLDPTQAIIQAQAIRDALIRRRTEATADFNQRFDALASDLQALDDQIATIVKAEALKPLVFSHPVYQYFIRHYGLNGREIHWEPEESPSAEQWVTLERVLEDHPCHWMVWEGEPNPATVDELKKLGLESLTFDPCGNVPESGDYLSVMRANILDLNKAYAR